jgi:hypothetical protein
VRLARVAVAVRLLAVGALVAGGALVAIGAAVFGGVTYAAVPDAALDALRPDAQEQNGLATLRFPPIPPGFPPIAPQFRRSLAGFAIAAAPREFAFPQDHGPHPDFRQEWWYLTGNLTATDGERFGCLAVADATGLRRALRGDRCGATHFPFRTEV